MPEASQVGAPSALLISPRAAPGVDYEPCHHAEREEESNDLRRRAAPRASQVVRHRRTLHALHVELATTGSSTEVRHQHVGQELLTETRLPDAATQRHVLVVEVKGLVEATEGEERFSPHGEAGSAEPVDVDG